MNSLTKLKKSVRGYLDHRSRERLELNGTLNDLAKKLDDTIIFGGMLREFGLGNRRNFASDIDIVACASRKDIYGAICHFSPKLNKFGGYRFAVGAQLFDIWAFEDTWAFREGLVKGSKLSDIFKTTFFNLDAAAFHLGKNEFLYAANYECALKNRLLDVNLQENPAPNQMSRRAIRMAIQNGLHITPQLGSYVLDNANRQELDPTSKSFFQALELHMALNESENFQFNPQPCLI